MKKKAFFLIAILFATTFLSTSAKAQKNAVLNGVYQRISIKFTDTRDGHIFKGIKIGNQIWMMDNLAYNPNDETNSKLDFRNEGYLYNWKTAQKACPVGWHLPTKQEFDSLINYVSEKGETAFKSSDVTVSYFKAQFAGHANSKGEITDKYSKAFYWSATESENFDFLVWCLFLDKNTEKVDIVPLGKGALFSVRCIKNIAVNPKIVNKLTDKRDEHVYNTKWIGNQCWMAENLAYKTDTGSWAYKNKERKVEKYGRLYNWKTAQKVCPEGWHLPSLWEWEILMNVNSNHEGVGLKSQSKFWKKSNKKATNSTGFTAEPAGCHSDRGFFSIRKLASFWSSTFSDNDNAYCLEIYYYSGEAEYSEDLYSNGFSVRCVKNP